MGGEKGSRYREQVRALGSPPRGRGKAHDFIIQIRSMRITPAWAGKSIEVLSYRFKDWDHPRVGGEKAFCYSVVDAIVGSPPRGRGKDVQPGSPGIAVGITPAWAGKRLFDDERSDEPWDHPRVGGEKYSANSSGAMPSGLPPRRRGKVSGRRHKSLVPGITPAWAGKSLFCFTAAVPIQDHPRMGGEKLLTCERIDFRLGSPPRGRGKGFGGLHMSVFSRITPAWAGKSPLRPRHCAGG